MHFSRLHDAMLEPLEVRVFVEGNGAIPAIIDLAEHCSEEAIRAEWVRLQCIENTTCTVTVPSMYDWVRSYRVTGAGSLAQYLLQHGVFDQIVVDYDLADAWRHATPDSDMLEAIEAYVDIYGNMPTPGEFTERYVGEFLDETGFLDYLLEDEEGISLPDWLEIDYDATMRKVMQGFHESDMHYFRII